MKRRQAERHWLTSGLTVHIEIYVTSKETVTKIVHDAKLAYFSSKIADCTNCKQLFHVTDKLLGRHKLLPLPTTISLDCLPDQFSSYLHEKVAIIRNQLDCRTSHAPASPYNHDIEFHHTPFTSFQSMTIYTQSLQSVHLSHVNSTPYLHPFFWSVWIQYSQPWPVSLMTPLSHGVFPSSYKSAIVTPLLRKPSLDPNDLKNYRTF